MSVDYLKGEQRLYDELYELFLAWQAAGSPKRSDYLMEFVRLEENATPAAPQIWAIDRKFYRQIFSLPHLH